MRALPTVSAAVLFVFGDIVEVSLTSILALSFHDPGLLLPGLVTFPMLR
jgi:hypothetical protein